MPEKHIPIELLTDSEVRAQLEAHARPAAGTRAMTLNPLAALVEDAERALGYKEVGSADAPHRVKVPAMSRVAVNLSQLIADGEPAPNIYGVTKRPTGETLTLDPRAIIEQHSVVAQAGARIIIATPRDKAVPVGGERTSGLMGWYADPQLVRQVDPALFSVIGDPVVSAIAIVGAGSGYTDGTYTLDSAGGGGSGAVATATVAGGAVTAVAVTAGGTSYGSAPAFSLPVSAGAGTGAVFRATVTAVDAPVSPIPTHDAIFTWPDVATAAFRTTITRAQNRALGGGEDLRAALLDAIFRGVAEYADSLLLAAITAAAPAAFTFGAVAAQHLKFDSLKAVVGTSGTGAVVDAKGNLAVMPFNVNGYQAGGIPAELSAMTASTFIGAFGTAAVAIWPELTVQARRLSTAGDLEVTCLVNAQAVLPNVNKFWSVTAS